MELDPKRTKWIQRTQLVSMIMVFVLMLLLIQLWLVTLAIEEYLGAHSTLAMPTFLASFACFGLNLRLLKYVNDIDKKG